MLAFQNMEKLFKGLVYSFLFHLKQPLFSEHKAILQVKLHEMLIMHKHY